MRQLSIVTAVFCLCFVSLNALAQNETDPRAIRTEGSPLTQRVFKAANPQEDKTETVDITATGKISFMVSNLSDGSPNSYRHTKRIVVPLLTAQKGGSYQLVFYGEYESLAYSVETAEGVTSIYFPMAMYGDIKQKLDGAASGKKVQLKLVLRKDGFREASLF